VPVTFGVDRLLADPALRRPLEGRRVAVLAHPASVTADGEHTVDALARVPGLRITAAFGPQHGFRGDKQDNMVETDDAFDPVLKIPVFSLYGRVRRPTPAMMEPFDVLLVDLQDVGTRIYTFLTTLRYVLEAAAAAGKAVWVLDRPNPAGREVEGTLLLPGHESFVGAGPLPMRHGLTLGEAAAWFVHQLRLDLDWRVIEMTGYRPDEGPGFGWPLLERPWVNPSPNAASLNMARCYPGSVLLEGTTLSEGRGSTVPLEGVWAPDLDRDAILGRMRMLAPQWTGGCWLRPCAIEPTFHKHVGRLCHGIQVHTDLPTYAPAAFRPYRLFSLFFKALRTQHPDYPLWRDFPYEYTEGRLAIDVIDGGPLLRRWVDDPSATVEDREERLLGDERAWSETRRPFLRYP
jgi:uncharacterized protein YbbC (DUF1343 family)